MYSYLFKQVKNIIPKISETELIALQSGGVNLDRQIFAGKVDLTKLGKNNKPLNDYEKNYVDNVTNQLLKNIGQQQVFPNKNFNSISNKLSSNGIFGMIIDKKYSGNKLSVTAQSKVVAKIASYNPSLGVFAMVPNSLGPGELLQHYGTEEQKDKYLTKLATGKMIPCFGLTGPNNGSDATGSIDEGTVIEKDGNICITVTLNKRYITLAPVADLIGIAFNLKDPRKLLKKGKEGITLVLVEKNHEGLLLDSYHNPNNAGFPNGTVKGNISIKLDQIIGGEEKAGNGWQMLMDCLAAGRGISLPASAYGSSKLGTYATLNYIKHRKQFKIPIGQMEGVKEKFINMFFNTWVIYSSVNFTNHILDQGSTPSVLTAIMKQQTTERARTVLNHGMDIFGGSAICTGSNNLFTPFYNSSPVGITVEGSNTLTRSLIIFGQGLNKSHPYIYNIFKSTQTNNLDDFKNNFNAMVKDVVKNYGYSLFNNRTDSIKRLEMLTCKFSTLTNFVALLGGKIKGNQMISGNMADILSNIYLGYSLVWTHNNYTSKDLDKVRDYCIHELCQEAERKLNLVIYNYPNSMIRFLLTFIKVSEDYSKFKDVNDIYKFISENKEVVNILKDGIYYEGTVVEKLEKLNEMEPTSKEYKDLYQDIISVGEYRS